MKNFNYVLLFFMMFFLSGSLFSAYADNCQPPESKKISISESSPVYNPPANTKIRRREAGLLNSKSEAANKKELSSSGTRAGTRAGTRSAMRAGTCFASHSTVNVETIKQYPSRMEPLAARHTGYTTQKQPILSWFVSEPCSSKMCFTLNEIKGFKPILKTSFNSPDAPGIYSIDLSKYNVSLEPEKEYEWFVYIIIDENERSSDFLASATIKLVNPDQQLINELKQSSPDKHYYVYACSGYWYDAIEHVSHLVDQHPENKVFNLHRANLLKQVELLGAYAYDRKDTES